MSQSPTQSPAPAGGRARSTAASFRAAAERGDLAAAEELFAPRTSSSTALSPSTRSSGRETVTRLLALVAQTFEDFRYTDELESDGAHALIFRASIAGSELEGIDLLRFDEDGLIADFTVMLRPLSGLMPFAQAMGEKVAAAGLQTTRA